MSRKELVILQHALAHYLQQQRREGNEIDREYIDLYFKITAQAVETDEKTKALQI